MKKLSIYVVMIAMGSMLLTSCEKAERPCNPGNVTHSYETRGGEDEVVTEEGDGTITDGGTSSEHDKGKGKRNPRP